MNDWVSGSAQNVTPHEADEQLRSIEAMQDRSARLSAVPMWARALFGLDWGFMVAGVCLLSRSRWAIALLAASVLLTMGTSAARRRHGGVFVNPFGHARAGKAALTSFIWLAVLGVGTVIATYAAQPPLGIVVAAALVNAALAVAALSFLLGGIVKPAVVA